MSRKNDKGALLNEFLNLEHFQRTYLSIIGYAMSSDGRNSRAFRWIQERAPNIDPSSWKERLQDGDTEVWREMLLLRAAGKLSFNDLIAPLESEAAWKRYGACRHMVNSPAVRLCALTVPPAAPRL
jgi:hypothetical protein